MFPVGISSHDFMTPDELAEFMTAPTTLGSGTDFRQKAPFLQSTADSDEEDYGNFPMNVDEAEAIEKLFENITDHGETPEEREPTPANMTCVLKEYQRIGLTWLLKMERGSSKGGILADEMGLGKTVSFHMRCAPLVLDG